MKRNLAIYILLFFLCMLPFTNHVQASQGFLDVPKSNWAYESVNWATEKGLVKGYDDGTFKPYNSLTESQLAAIMSRYYNPELEKGLDKSKWSDAHYEYLKKSGVLLSGHFDSSSKNKVVTRLQLAKALYASRGLIGTDKEVIDWMYANNITGGKGISKDKYEDFGGDDGLKRAHVSAFFYKMDRLRFWTMASETGKDELRGEALYREILPFFEVSNYTLTRSPDGFIQGRSSVMEDGMTFAPRIDIENTNDGDQLYIANHTPRHLSSVELVSKTIVAFGVKVDPSVLAATLHEFAVNNDNAKKTVKYGNYTINMEMYTSFIEPLNKYSYRLTAYVEKKK